MGALSVLSAVFCPVSAQVAGGSAEATKHASLVGEVRDSLGRRVASATVTITHIESDASVSVRTDSGRFAVTRLPPGTYQVGAIAIGYTPTLIDGLSLRAGGQDTVSLVLQRNAVVLEEMIVTASRPVRSGPTYSANDSRNALGYEELRAFRQSARLLEAIQQLRPMYVARGSVFRATPRVYIDGQLIPCLGAGDACLDRALNELSVDQVLDVEYLPAVQSYLKKGSDVPSILIRRRR